MRTRLLVVTVVLVVAAGLAAWIALGLQNSRSAQKVAITFTVSSIPDVGTSPRHLVMSPTGRWLYATLSADGTVAKIDPRTGRVVARVSTGSQPRSMAIAPDGQSLYVERPLPHII